AGFHTHRNLRAPLPEKSFGFFDPPSRGGWENGAQTFCRTFLLAARDFCFAISRARARRTSCTPSPLTPEIAKTRRPLAFSSEARFFAIASFEIASILLSVTISGFSLRPWP